jgi:PTS system cellobiose-specific IIC component
MKGLEKLSTKLNDSPAFRSISTGMMGTMGIIMVGAIIQIILTLASYLGLSSDSACYSAIYAIYQMTMGSLSLFVAFNMAYDYAKNLKMSAVNAGFLSIICFFLVCVPVQSAMLADGSSISALDLSGLGSTSMFMAILIALSTVRISKLAMDHNLMIKMPDVVPEGIMNSFNSVIPYLINIALWYGLACAVQFGSNGAMTLNSLVMHILSVPLSYLISPAGVVLMILLAQFFWFFGIHGTNLVYTVVMAPMLAAYMNNGALAAQGKPLVFSAVFLMSANGLLGGAGNTLPLVIMGVNSKSKTIKAVCKAALPINIFGINEPVIFGLPIMYNPILLIPFLLNPVIVALLLWFGYSTFLALPQVLLMTTLPVFVTDFMSTFSYINVLYSMFVLFPVCFCIWFPFFKVYEAKMLKQEQEVQQSEAEQNLQAA